MNQRIIFCCFTKQTKELFYYSKHIGTCTIYEKQSHLISIYLKKQIAFYRIFLDWSIPQLNEKKTIIQANKSWSEFDVRDFV